MRNLLLILFSIFLAQVFYAQCNTDVTICEPGVAGPFDFIPATSEVGSCQDFINGTTAANYAYIVLYITESGPLSLLIEGNSPTGFIDVSIFNVPPGQDPCNAILDVNNEIGCNYAVFANGCNQFGTEFPCTSTAPSPFVNAGDVLMILVEDWSSAQTNFTLELGDPPNAQTGPPDATILPAGPFDESQTIASIIAADPGGTWSADCGACIDPDTGIFDPSVAGEGTWEICYTIGADPCDASDCIDVLVLPSSLVDCQEIIPQIDSSIPIANGPDGEIDLCQGETLTISGSALYPENNTDYFQEDATSIFVWDMGDGNTVTGQSITYNYTLEGLFLLSMYVVDIEGCVSDVVTQVIRVSPTPTFIGTGVVNDVICLGEQNELYGFYQSEEFVIECDPVDAELVALPDNVNETYSSPLTVSCFPPGTVLTDINDLESICLEIEHSWLGDLEIEIECPSGQTVTLLDYPNSGGSTYLGIPDQSDSPLLVGTGYEYCFTPDATNGTLDSGFGATVPAGDYSSEFPLTGLLGCELNGDWTLSITDNLNLDNGFLFSWEVNFDQSSLPFSDGISFEPVIVDEGWIDEPTIVSETGNTIIVEPVNPGTNCYTYFVEDDFGCVYDTLICFEVLDLPELAVLSGPASICNGQSEDIQIGFTGVGPWTVNYTFEGVAQPPLFYTTNPATLTVDQAGDYVFTTIEDQNCVNQIDLPLNVPETTSPTVDLLGPLLPICAGDTAFLEFTFTGDAPWEVVYSIDNTNQPPIITSENPFILPVTDAGTYIPVSVNSSGCPGTISGYSVVSFTDPFSVELSGGGVICTGETINLDLTFDAPFGAYTLVYSIDGVPQPPVTVIPAVPYITVDSPGLYELISFSSLTCDGEVSGSAMVNSASGAEATLSGDIVTCPGGNGDLTIELLGTAPWDLVYAIDGVDQPPLVINSSPYTLNVSTAGTYTLTSVFDAISPCEGLTSGTGTFTELEIPTADISGGAALCDGESTDLTITLTGTGPWDVVYALDGVDQPSINIASSPYTLTTSDAGDYTLTSVSDSNCDGTVSGTASVTTSPLPTADISGGAALCDGESTDLTITLTGTGPWDVVYALDGVDQPSINIASSPYTLTTSDTGDYTLTSVTDANCDGTVSGMASVTTSPLPTADISGGAALCDGESTDLTITLTGTGPWDVVYALDGVDQPSINIASSPYTLTTSDAGDYTLTSVSDANCDGTVSGTVSVTTSPLPTADISGGAALCDGESTDLTITLTGTGPWDVVYALDGVDQPALNVASSPYTLSTSDPGDYTLTSVTDANCNGTVSGTASVTTSPLPTADISGGAALCDGESTDLTITLTGTGPWDVVYALDGVDQPPLVINSSPYTLNVSTAGTYTLTSVFDAISPCEGLTSGTGTFTELEIPTADISGGAALCDGESTDLTITLTGTGPWDVVYALDGVDQPSINIASSPYTLTTSDAGDYTLTSVSDANCDGTVSGTASVTTSPLPTADISGGAALCDGESTDLIITLTGTGPWDVVYALDGVDQPSINIASSPYTLTTSDAGDYTLTSVSDANCDGTVSGTASVTTSPLPTADISGGAALCDGESTDLIITLTGTGPWDIVYALDGVDQPSINIASSPYTLTTSDAGDYTLTSVTDANCDGTVSGTASVTTSPLPTADISGGAALCDGESTDLTITLTGTGPWDVVYALDGVDQPALNIASSPYTLSTSDPGDYTLTSVSDANCDGTVSGTASVTTSPLPTADISGGAALCDGESTDLTITLTGTGPWDVVYALDGVDQPPLNIASSPYTLSTSDPGDYTLTLVSDANCDGTVSGTASVTTSPLPTADISGGAALCDGESTDLTITLTGTGPWDVVYALDGVDQPTLNIASSPYTLSTSDPGDYTLTSVTDANCDGTVSGTASVTTSPLPTADISGGAALCDGESTDLTITLTGTGPWDVVYALDGVDQPSINIASSPYTLTTSDAGDYTLTSVSDANCDGTVSGTASVTTSPLPTADISGGAALCDGESTDLTITLTGTGPWDVVYALDGVDQPTLNIASSPYTLSTSDPGDYTLTSVTDANCDGTVSGTASVTTSPLPTADISGGAALCDGESTDLTITLTGTGP